MVECFKSEVSINRRYDYHAKHVLFWWYYVFKFLEKSITPGIVGDAKNEVNKESSI